MRRRAADGTVHMHSVRSRIRVVYAVYGDHSPSVYGYGDTVYGVGRIIFEGIRYGYIRDTAYRIREIRYGPRTLVVARAWHFSWELAVLHVNPPQIRCRSFATDRKLCSCS